MTQISLNIVFRLFAGLNLSLGQQRNARRETRNQVQVQNQQELDERANACSASENAITSDNTAGTGPDASPTDPAKPPPVGTVLPSPPLPPPTANGYIPLPGMVRTTPAFCQISFFPKSHSRIRDEDIHLLTASRPFFTPRASTIPDLILRYLPTEILLLVCSNLPILDLLSLRDSCRAFAGVVDKPILLGAMTAQNHAGWPIAFEFQGQKYTGTTYGNRKLCGICLRPKPTSHVIRGEYVVEYLVKRNVAVGMTWDVTSGMCWPCLWINLVEEPNGTPDIPIWKRANISPTEIFEMMDGSKRKPCENCARDIHINAVPCPYCTNFGHWLRHKDCCGKDKPYADRTKDAMLSRT